MPSMYARSAAIALLAFTTTAGAGQSYFVHGSKGSNGSSSKGSSSSGIAARLVSPRGETQAYRPALVPQSNYGAIRYYGGYSQYYPAYPTYPTYPAYPAYPVSGYQGYYPGSTYYQYGRSGTLPSTHTYGYYDFGRHGRNSGGGYRDGYRDGYQDGRRDRHGTGRNDDRHCNGDC